MPNPRARRCDVAVLIDVESGERAASGSFVPDRGSMEAHVARVLRTQHARVEVVPFEADITTTVAALNALKPKLVFNLTEWVDGDRRLDSAITGLLDVLKLRYTGAGPVGMQLARDKALSKRIVADLGITVPRHIVIEDNRLNGALPAFPAIVKPQFGDGSDAITGRSYVRDRRQLAAQVRALRTRAPGPLLCEEYVEGTDLFVALLGNEPKVMPPLALKVGRKGSGAPIIATTKVKNDGKYRSRWRIRYEVPDLPEALLAKINAASRQIFHALQLRDYARIDYRLTADNELVFLEANPNPDLTPHTFGRNRCFAGMGYAELIGGIVGAARGRGRME
jgi:D-alanine-D-alanine ligase